jgi:hypothetical protein
MFVRWRNSPSKWVRFRCLTGILFTVVHLFEESSGLLLVREAQPGQTFFGFESVKESSVLVVRPCVVYFLIPYHASVRRLQKVSNGPVEMTDP